jgi:hypothetical protein
LPLLGYTGLFFLATHVFVVSYEEPALRRTFPQVRSLLPSGQSRVAACLNRARCSV